MEIILAKNIGFCPGVKRAVKIAQKAIKKHGPPIFLFGPLVHNEEVAKAFKKQGALEASSVKKVPLGARLIVSAHGIGPILRKEILEKKIKITDTTCPWVKRTHNFVENISLKGYEIILLGEKRHREVKGIEEWGSKIWVASSLKEVKSTFKKIKKKKVAFISQTTQRKKLFDEAAELLRNKFPKIIIFDTICRMTLLRQKEIEGLAKKSDVMVVVGSKNSANSKRLYEISKKINKKTHFVSGLGDLKKEWFKKTEKIGISSGASAPPEFVRKIKRKIQTI